MLSGKNIVIGISGGIAVYKICDVVSRLKKLNANIDIIMTKSAAEFVTPLTFQSLIQNYVVVDMFEQLKTWNIEHISLAQKSDLFLIAPATANIIGKIANGIADDMLSTTVMATTAPVLIAPAMNTKMYENMIVQDNILKLKKFGYKFIDPESGRLACGDIGKGKLASPENIVEKVVSELTKERDLKNKKILITAGPTRESIDPVRYITNRSSGKMGYSIAKEAVKRGALVTLISGPTNMEVPQGIEKFIPIESALDMYNTVMENINDNNIMIGCAAVADYKPKNKSLQKIKKSDNDLSLELDRNYDILKEIGKIKNDKILVGFAAETNDLIENAKGKIEKKNLDFIVANDLTLDGAGFGVDTNIVKIIDKDGIIENYPKMGKDEVANIILDKIKLLSEK